MDIFLFVSFILLVLWYFMIIVYMTFMSVFRKMQIFYCYYLYALELYTVTYDYANIYKDVNEYAY